MIIRIMLFAVLGWFAVTLNAATAPTAQPAPSVASPNAHVMPPWFKESFLDFRDDVRDAAKANKRVMIYFGQDGCPYCKQLIETNFTQKDIVAKMKKHFEAIEINLWGDRETVWIDGKTRSEKELAKALKVNFTPTLLFLDETGKVVLRLNGYYPPSRFSPALDYVAQRKEKTIAFSEYMKTAGTTGTPATGILHDEAFFMKPPLVLQRNKIPAKKPLLVFFEQAQCPGCDEMHSDALKRPEIRALMDKFDVARIDIRSNEPVLTPDGKKMTSSEWAKSMTIGYTPSLLFFDPRGNEIFRTEAYLKSFHLQSALEYVASGAYAKQPEFQRYIESRAAAIRERGGKVELWK